MDRRTPRSAHRDARRPDLLRFRGDFFDYADQSSGGFAFTLGDVAGKGPPAALLSALLQGMFSIEAQGADAPSSVVSRVNAALFKRVDDLHTRRASLGLAAEALRVLERYHLDFVRTGAKLTDTQRSLVLLKDYEGYSYQEIGQITALSESQVKVYLHRARVQLKNYLVKPENVI